METAADGGKCVGCNEMALDGCPNKKCALQLCTEVDDTCCTCSVHARNSNMMRRQSSVSESFFFCSSCTKSIKPKRIILVRHEESLGNIDESAYVRIPDWKIPITSDGVTHGKITSQTVKGIVGDDPVYIYTSPYLRTKHTTQLILESFQPSQIVGVREEPRIVEQQFGNFQDSAVMKKAKAERWRYGSFFYRFPNGESGLDVYNRAADFISTLYRDFTNPFVAQENLNIIVVTHGLTMRLFLMRWFQYSVEEFENTKNPENGGVIVMEKHENVAGNEWFELTPKSLDLLQFPPAGKPYTEELVNLQGVAAPRPVKHKFWRKMRKAKSSLK